MAKLAVIGPHFSRAHPRSSIPTWKSEATLHCKAVLMHLLVAASRRNTDGRDRAGA